MMQKILKSGKVGVQCKIPFDEWYQAKIINEAHNYLGAANVIFYEGPSGRIRVSRRFVDEKASTPGFQIQKLDAENPVKEGEIVRISLAMLPIGMKFFAGEKLRLRISGKDPVEFPPVDKLGPKAPDLPNPNAKVSVTVYGGGNDGRGSYIVLPHLVV